MLVTRGYRTVTITAVLVAALSAGCTSTTTGAGSKNTSLSTTTTSIKTTFSPQPTTAPTPTPIPAPLSKADFVVQANALCNRIEQAGDAVPTPADGAGYAAVAEFLQVELNNDNDYITSLASLINSAADKDELTAKWLTPDQEDFTPQRAIIEKAIAAANAGDGTTLNNEVNRISDTPPHENTIVAFLKSYGVPACVKLEDS